jgi:phage I-like protein
VTRLRALISMKGLSSPPGEIQIIPYGTHETDRGAFSLREEDMRRVVEDFDSRRNDMVIDYEHQGLSGGEAPAAGWIKRLISRGKDGVWASVEWTPRARAYLGNREYRYLSPVFLKRLSDNRVVRLLGAALTNTPAIDGMVPVVNKKDSRGQGVEGSRVFSEPSTPGTPGPFNEERKEERGMKKVLSALGLTAGATEEEALKALEAMRKRGDSPVSQAVLSALGLEEGAGEGEALAAVAALRQGAESLNAALAELVELRARLSKVEAEELVASAMKAGKLTPAQNEWALSYAGRDPEGFRVFVARAPAVVPTGELAALGAGAPAAAAGGMQLAVNRLLMVSDEAYRKFGKIEQGDT